MVPVLFVIPLYIGKQNLSLRFNCVLQSRGRECTRALPRTDVGWGLWAINNVMTPGLRCLLSCIDFIQRALWLYRSGSFCTCRAWGVGRPVPSTCGCVYGVLPKPFGALHAVAQQLWGVCSGAYVGEESPQRVMQLIIASCP